MQLGSCCEMGEISRKVSRRSRYALLSPALLKNVFRPIKVQYCQIYVYIVKNPIITVLKKIKSNVSNSTQAKLSALIIAKPMASKYLVNVFILKTLMYYTTYEVLETTLLYKSCVMIFSTWIELYSTLLFFQKTVLINHSIQHSSTVNRQYTFHKFKIVPYEPESHAKTEHTHNRKVKFVS